MRDRETLRRRFARGDAWFDTSPLYRVLTRAVAGDEDLLDLAAEARPGQQATNMLMAATHLLVLKDPSLPFARFFGDDPEPPEAAAANRRHANATAGMASRSRGTSCRPRASAGCVPGGDAV